MRQFANDCCRSSSEKLLINEAYSMSAPQILRSPKLPVNLGSSVMILHRPLDRANGLAPRRNVSTDIIQNQINMHRKGHHLPTSSSPTRSVKKFEDTISLLQTSRSLSAIDGKN